MPASGFDGWLLTPSPLLVGRGEGEKAARPGQRYVPPDEKTMTAISTAIITRLRLCGMRDNGVVSTSA